MAAWLNGGKCLALDLESTGTDVFEDRIVTACAAIVADGEVLFQRDWLVAVDVDIPEAASAVHGISTEHARTNGVPAGEAVAEIANAVRYAVHSGFPIVAYNAVFDLSMLNAECVRHGLGTLAEFCGRDIAPVIDPLCIDRHVDRFRPGKRKLVDTCGHFGVELAEDDAHNAVADALAAVRVATKMAERCDLDDKALLALYADRRYPDGLLRGYRALGKLTVDRLHAAQIQWYAEDSERLGQYWRKESNRLRHDAETATEEGRHDDAAQATQEADELDARVDSLSTEWPLRVAPVAVSR